MVGRGRQDHRDLADAVRLRRLDEATPFLGYALDPADCSRWRRADGDDDKIRRVTDCHVNRATEEVALRGAAMPGPTPRGQFLYRSLPTA